MKKLIFLIHKIGGAGLLLPYQKLRDVVLNILKGKESGTQIIVVVSALAKITRMLQDIFEKKINGDTRNALEVFQSLKKIHLQRCKDLKIKDLLRMYDYFYEIEFFIRDGSINKDNHTISKAQLLKFGELMSSEIFNQFLVGMNLSVKLIDAQNMIYASGEDYCYSSPIQPQTSETIFGVINSESIHNFDVILTQGYICKERLLGLDGSDLTAGIISYALQEYNHSTELYFWKDIDGVYDNGIFIEFISYKDFINLPTTPVRKDAIIQIYKYAPKTIVRSFKNLNNLGTTIIYPGK